MNLDLEELAAIIEQLDQADFTEFRYEKGDFRMHVRRGGHDAGPLDWAPANGSPVAAPASTPAAPATPASSDTAPAATAAPAPVSPAATAAPAQVSPAAAAPPGPTAPVAPSPTPAAPASAALGAALDPANLPEGHVAVTAPMLGTFYGAPKPGAAPFVAVGDAVGPDTTLCIIEVMKLMNSVPAGVSGEVTAVFLSDGDLAEFDQPLFAVKVSA